MKTNSERPAFPVEIDSRGEGMQTGIESGMATGLSKREYFAAKAMQGILANPAYSKEFQVNDWWIDQQKVCQLSLAHADELLKQLIS